MLDAPQMMAPTDTFSTAVSATTTTTTICI